MRPKCSNTTHLCMARLNCCLHLWLPQQQRSQARHFMTRQSRGLFHLEMETSQPAMSTQQVFSCFEAQGFIHETVWCTLVIQDGLHLRRALPPKFLPSLPANWGKGRGFENFAATGGRCIRAALVHLARRERRIGHWRSSTIAISFHSTTSHLWLGNVSSSLPTSRCL